MPAPCCAVTPPPGLVDLSKTVPRDWLQWVDSVWMGGADWNKRKSRARKAVREIAAELIKLYAARQATKGYAFGADTVDVFRVSEVMAEKGWVPGLVQKPRAIHRMMSLIHADSMDEYLDDLRAAVGVVRQEVGSTAKIQATY